MRGLGLFGFACIFILSIACAAPAARAATLTADGAPGVPPSGVTADHDPCTISLSGTIAAGDAATFANLVQRVAPGLTPYPDLLGNPRIVTLCLDSEGGSLTEALRIAEQIRKDRTWTSPLPFIVTRIRAGARCESACALVFLAGTLDDFEGPAYPARSMHPTARLGIHAPALPLAPGGLYQGQDVQAAYDISTESIADVLRLLHVGEDPAGNLYSGIGNFSDSSHWMVGSMLEAMLRTPPDRMRYIETVDDAGRWSIGVAPIRETPIDVEAVAYACLNTDAWASGHPSNIHPAALTGGSGREAPIEDTLGGSVIRRFLYSVDEMNGKHCEVLVRTEGRFSLEATYPTRGARRALAFFDPKTPLATLAPTASRNTGVLPWAPRFGGDKVTIWSHNGSLMAWESRGTSRWVWYYQPRPELQAEGVEMGQLLFDGTLQNGVLTGRARVFSAGCGTLTYPVSGPAQGTRVTLRGRRLVRTDTCQANGERNDTLTFDYLRPPP